MKKLLFLAATLTCSFVATSCLDDDGNEAKSSIQYYATCDDLTFTDENDTIYKELILESFNNLKLAGVNSIFTQDAKIDNGYISEAVAECNRLATEKYEKLSNSYNLKDIKLDIFENHKDSLGLENKDQLPLDGFTAKTSFWSSITQDAIKTYTKIYK